MIYSNIHSSNPNKLINLDSKEVSEQSAAVVKNNVMSKVFITSVSSSPLSNENALTSNEHLVLKRKNETYSPNSDENHDFSSLNQQESETSSKKKIKSQPRPFPEDFKKEIVRNILYLKSEYGSNFTDVTEKSFMEKICERVHEKFGKLNEGKRDYDYRNLQGTCRNMIKSGVFDKFATQIGSETNSFKNSSSPEKQIPVVVSVPNRELFSKLNPISTTAKIAIFKPPTSEQIPPIISTPFRLETSSMNDKPSDSKPSISSIPASKQEKSAEDIKKALKKEILKIAVQQPEYEIYLKNKKYKFINIEFSRRILEKLVTNGINYRYKNGNPFVYNERSVMRILSAIFEKGEYSEMKEEFKEFVQAEEKVSTSVFDLPKKLNGQEVGKIKKLNLEEFELEIKRILAEQPEYKKFLNGRSVVQNFITRAFAQRIYMHFKDQIELLTLDEKPQFFDEDTVMRILKKLVNKTGHLYTLNGK